MIAFRDFISFGITILIFCVLVIYPSFVHVFVMGTCMHAFYFRLIGSFGRKKKGIQSTCWGAFLMVGPLNAAVQT